MLEGVGGVVGVRLGVGCLCPPVRKDIVTLRHLFFLDPLMLKFPFSTANETRDMIEESRHRLLRLEGVSYLTQYEDGRILQKTIHELHSRTEELAEVDEGQV